jgi:hypothetical protein
VTTFFALLILLALRRYKNKTQCNNALLVSSSRAFGRPSKSFVFKRLRPKNHEIVNTRECDEEHQIWLTLFTLSCPRAPRFFTALFYATVCCNGCAFARPVGSTHPCISARRYSAVVP